AGGMRLVDVGGGRGEFAAMARENSYATLLIDGNPSNVEHERRGGHDAKELDLNQGLRGLDEASFDCASCLDVIEHIVPSELLLSEIHRVLKPGGTLILSTPNFGYAKDRVAYLLGHNVREEGYHFRFFTQGSLLQKASDAGFRRVGSCSSASPLLVRSLVRFLTLGRVQLQPFICPPALETWLASTFIWKLTKSSPGPHHIG
ncbi:MAG: class I SAM-dependent methyltransferase, partial [Thermoleophilaceae bacterium]